jgi:peptidoglycan/LPS O-acetylase OafA/YrhL
MFSSARRAWSSSPSVEPTLQSTYTYSRRRSFSGRLPSLDGLRAAALFSVLLNHANGTLGFPRPVAAVLDHPLFGFSELGLKFFFIISGFMITLLLLREYEQQGTIDWTRFVIRRSARIFPGYFTFVALVTILGAVGVLSIESDSVVRALTFTVYTTGERSWELGHLWSMGMQEHFYLVWPLLFMFHGKRGASKFAVATILVFFTGRLVAATMAPGSFTIFSYGTSFDTLALGCLFALHRERLSRLPWFNRLVGSRAWIAAFFFAGNLAGLLGYRPSLLLRLPLISIAILLMIERCVRRPQGLAGRILNARLMAYVGGASFSIYLWQQIFLHRASSALLTSFPVNIVVAIAVGLLSHHLIERPGADFCRDALTRIFAPPTGAAARRTLARGGQAIGTFLSATRRSADRMRLPDLSRSHRRTAPRSDTARA